MSCWCCKYYSAIDYRVDDHGVEQPYGVCLNENAGDYNEEVPEGYECSEYECKEER